MNSSPLKNLAIFYFLARSFSMVWAQTPTVANEEQTTPVAISPLLDAVGPIQRKAIEAVYIIECKDKHGTGFLLTKGVIVTNEHVVDGCDAGSILARSSNGKDIRFTKMITDGFRDLTLLVPTEKIKGGLELGTDKAIKAGQNVTTWGFPLIYTSGAPLLSVGYVAGFNDDIEGDHHVKHIVVNGAFNPGNSGGPVFAANNNKVIGIVVWKQRLTSGNVPIAIHGLKNSAIQTGGTFTKRLPNGQTVGASNEEVIAAVLDEFYNLVQVQIGEAISVSELNAFLAERESQLK